MNTGQGVADGHGFGSRLFQFSEELGRRRVWKTALAYGAVVFVLLQLGEIVFPVFGAPTWALRLLVICCFLGFPVVLCLAWVFDITPRGIKKTLGVAHDNGGLFASGKALPRLAFFAVTLATMGGLGWWTVQDAIQPGVQGGQLGTQGGLLAGSEREGPPVVRSLAVLPLDDFSEEEGGAYFTAGLHEEIVSHLSQVDAVQVVSRTSVVQYDRSGKTMPAIARDLGVDAVVEGSVFRSGDRVRVTVQLIHGPTDTHLWANSYEGTVDDAIGLQREVAQAISREIQTEIFGNTVEPKNASRIADGRASPEPDQRGRKETGEDTPELTASSIDLHERALVEDPSFVPARDGSATPRQRMDFRRRGPEEGSPEDRIAGARRLAAASHYQEAEGILKTIVHEVDTEVSTEAWKVMEDIRAVRGDFEGIVALRMEQLSSNPGDRVDSVSLAHLKDLLSKEGEEGFWVWKVGELESLAEAGEPVSPVELARACVGVGDLDAAIPYLEQALQDGDKNLISLWTDPAWEALWPDTRFQELLTRVKRSSSGVGFPPL